MKIKINEKDIYEIELDDEYTLQEFLKLLERLVKVSQVLIKSSSNNS